MLAIHSKRKLPFSDKILRKVCILNGIAVDKLGRFNQTLLIKTIISRHIKENLDVLREIQIPEIELREDDIVTYADLREKKESIIIKIVDGKKSFMKREALEKFYEIDDGELDS